MLAGAGPPPPPRGAFDGGRQERQQSPPRGGEGAGPSGRGPRGEPAGAGPPLGAALAHLALGQFEAARALLRGGEEALRLLKEVALGGAGAGWLASASVQSDAHLRLLCAHQHNLLAAEEAQLPQAVLDGIELRLYLWLIGQGAETESQATQSPGAVGGTAAPQQGLDAAGIEKLQGLLLGEWRWMIEEEGLFGAPPGPGGGVSPAEELLLRNLALAQPRLFAELLGLLQVRCPRPLRPCEPTA